MLRVDLVGIQVGGADPEQWYTTGVAERNSASIPLGARVTQ